MEDNLQWRTDFDGRQSSMVDDLQCRTTFGGKNRAYELEGFLNWSLTLKTMYCFYIFNHSERVGGQNKSEQ